MRDDVVRSVVTRMLVIIITFLVMISPAIPASSREEQLTTPVVPQEVSKLIKLRPKAKDGYRGKMLIRRPPGEGPFPAVMLIHGGLTSWSTRQLREYALSTFPSRFLAAGYAVATITYRSRDNDPQSPLPLYDALAAVNYLQRLPDIDVESIGVYGCSGGGDLALSLAAEVTVAAIVAEEPASIMFTGIWDSSWPKAGERYTPLDAAPIFINGTEYYTPEHRRVTRNKIAKFRSPILIVQGDLESQVAINDFNADVLIPELQSSGKVIQVITYPGQPHCFSMATRLQAGTETSALKAFRETEMFFRGYMSVEPQPMQQRKVTFIPLSQQ